MESAPAAPPVRRREIVGWAMFDFANSSYTTVVVTVAFSVYFTTLVAPGGRGDALWGVALLISNGLTVLLSPAVGAMGDSAGRKKLLLFATYLLCVAATAALWLAVPGAALLAVVLFVASNIAFSLGENLSSAFLPEISTPRNVGRISGFGWGLGYFGGLASLLLIRPLLAGGFVADNLPSLRRVWPLTAGFFLVAALPTFLLLRERAPRGPRRPPLDYVREGFSRLGETFRSIRRFAELARFLAVFFVFSCGLTTVIAFSGVYASRTVGFTSDELILLFLALQVTSAGGAFLFGFIEDRIGARRTIQLALVLWMAVCVAAFLSRSKPTFWAVALAAGLGIGSLQSASRGLVGLFSPVTKSGEFFGFWGLAGKSAYALGPAIFGAISGITGSQRIAILLTTGFFVAGFLGMLFVDEERGRRAAAGWPAAPARP